MRLHVLALAMLMTLSAHATELFIHASALFEDRAMLTINGTPRVLKAGQTSPEGVRLISASAREAVIDVQGRRQTIELSRDISASFEAPESRRVSLTRNQRSEYIAGGRINGQRIDMVVDTGANVVAMNSHHARRVGLDYRRTGEPSQVRTASGVVDAWSVNLERVEVGELKVHNVRASVVEGDFPVHVLLGMSWLNHVQMREQDGVLYLEQ